MVSTRIMVGDTCTASPNAPAAATKHIRNTSPVRALPLEIAKKGPYVRQDGLPCVWVARGERWYVVPTHDSSAGPCTNLAEVNADGYHSIGGQHVRLCQPLGLEGSDIESIPAKGLDNGRRHRCVRSRAARDGA